MDSGPSTPGSQNGGIKLHKTNKELLAYMSQAFNANRGDDFEDRNSDDSSLDLDDDDDLSIGSSSSFSITTYNTSNDIKTVGDETRMLGDEGGLVKRSKVAIFMGIVLLACTSALITTYFVRKNENEIYHERFAAFSEELSEKSQRALHQAFAATEQLSRTLTDAMVNGSNFLALPFFELYGGEAKEAAKADVVFWTPRIAEAQRSEWEAFAVAHQQWILDGLAHENSVVNDPGSISANLYAHQEEAHHDHVRLHGYHFPVWQMAGAPRNASIVNFDLAASMAHDMVDATILRQPLLSSIQDLQYLTTPAQDTVPFASEQEWLQENNITIGVSKYNPLAYLDQFKQSYILQPIFATSDGYFFPNVGVAEARSGELQSDVVGFVVAVMSWDSLFSDILPNGIHGLVVVVADGCGTTLSYQVNGKSVEYLGLGDLHDPAFENLVVNVTDFGNLPDFSVVTDFHPEINGTTYDERHAGTKKGHCQFNIQIYPSTKFVDMYNTDTQSIYIAVIVVIFVIVVFLLCMYDLMVIARQRKILHIAKQTNTLISSLFPKQVQKRILEDASKNEKLKLLSADEYDQVLGDDSKAKSVMEEHMKGQYQTKAIADYFPSATIFFADIVGFTAWSSTREPTQVFELLETLFHSFDQLARKRRVFKVETVGDCYVAATGLPEARKDHAVVMSRFARDILYKFGVLVKQLEEKLGPDTGDLGLRVGLHSGPVTAGVLRGEKSRFQLFGDTVNTAARMESNGAPNRIHLSKETADLLMKAGKHKWVKAREELIHAKGKGELQTYWLEYSRTGSTRGSQSTSITDSIRSSLQSEHDDSKKYLTDITFNPMSEKLQRLVKWNTELLTKSLQLILARRAGSRARVDDGEKMRSLEMASRTVARQGRLVFDEVVEIINLPSKAETNDPDRFQASPESIELSPEVYSQLHDYVRTIAAMYPEDNPFHNFEHASHVCMSTIKLLARIVAPHDDDVVDSLHDNTYGITSDPLTQFAAVFSALIHDVDHPGVPNMTLVNEGTSLAVSYQNKSVAEQNSIDLAWDLLMDPAYEDLRRALYINETEFNRFRTLVVNLVMATDIMDKEMGAFRKTRWNKVFGDDEKDIRGSITQTDINRKATIVLEHLIQASDVSHTMQHWHIFVKWNERLFHEMYLAYDEGRAEKDPAENWYKGEIGFFDFYIIPLAKKLESCGVFGVSSDEYLQYAQNNRNEWERKGHEQVAKYLENYRIKREAMTMATPPSQIPQEEEA